ncbi:S-layer homology domain-containing protein [Candidatus Peregrinibacteria bacterium]|nr:S-layer homology domain-containing protein [Candidatus Peregrinibacteria bacterium]
MKYRASFFESFKRRVAKASLLILLISVIAPGLSVFTMPTAYAAVSEVIYQAVGGQGNTSQIIVTFNTAITDAEKLTSEQCSQVPTGVTACYNKSGITLVGGFANGITVDTINRVFRNDNVSNATLVITFTQGNVVANPGDLTTASITINGFGGLSNATTNLAGQQQQDPISNVVGSDPDTTSFGLDGRDFRVVWTPGGSTPAGFVAYRIFIVPNATTITASNVLTNGCNSGPCQDVGFYPNFAIAQHNVYQGRTQDSAMTAWNAATQYKACVLVDATTDTLTCSSAFSITNESGESAGADTAAPMIEHTSASGYPSGSQFITFATIGDPDSRTLVSEMIAGTEGAYVQMITDEATQSIVTAIQSGTLVNGTSKLIRFATTGLAADRTSVKYYLKARDKAGNIRYFTTNPAFDTAASGQTDAQAANYAFVANAGVAGSYTLSGTISTSEAGGAVVWLGGYGKDSVTAGGDGAYTFSNLPVGGFDVSAIKSGYSKQSRFEMVKENKTGINMTLNKGEFSYTAVSGGGTAAMSGGKPHVIFSGPPEGSKGFPLSDNIRVGFDTTINASTVNTTNVYLTTDDGTTKITGTVTYCINQAASGCSAIMAGDTKTILFDPAANLTVNTEYTLVITNAVTGDSGQSVEGNREGGGQNIHFSTGGGAITMASVSTGDYGKGQYAAPYVRSMVPGPGMSHPLTGKIMLEFNEQMNTGTLTPTNIELWKITGATPTQVTLLQSAITVDSAEQKFVTIDPGTLIADTEYEVRVKGAVANANGVTMRPPAEIGNNETKFQSRFKASASVSAGTLSITGLLATGATVPVNVGAFQFGASNQLLASTVSTSNITLTRGSSSVPFSVKYDGGENIVYVIPSAVLASGASYTITFIANGVQSLKGAALSAASVFSYTAGAMDNTAFGLKEARCDDYTCSLFFTEPVNSDSQVDSSWANSIINPANITLTGGVDTSGNGGTVVSLASGSGKTLSYDSAKNSLTIKGLALTVGQSFKIAIGANARDLSENAVSASAKTWIGKIENSSSTAGDFSGGGMFGSSTTGGAAAGAAFKPQGFGSATAEQFFNGSADNAFPFNPVASQDSNVFQIRFNPGVAVQDDDKVIITFPAGTDVTSAVPDTLSPFYQDMNENFHPGTVTFDSALDTDGVSVDAAARTVTVQLSVSNGTPGANDPIVIDLRGITNPAIPKGPETSGYTVGLKLQRGSTVQVNKTSMPYFIKAGGSYGITVSIKAGNASSPDSVSGNVFLHGGGPTGALDRNVTVTNGSGSVTFSGLVEGCYFMGTEPFVTLGANDYFGQMSPEPVCVNSGNTGPTKTIVLGSSSGTASVSLTVKFTGVSNFNGTDIDIFAGGPGRFVVKNLTGVNAPEVNGYTIKIPQNGLWMVGVGPGRPKGTSAEFMPKALPGVPPPPASLKVSGVGTASPVITAIDTELPENVTFNSGTRTLTVNFGAADKTVSGIVKDGSANGLQNVQIFMGQQGRGAPLFDRTKADGTFSIAVSKYGTYEIGAMKDGLPPAINSIEVKPDNTVTPNDANSDPDIIYKGKLITADNPLIITIRKPSYSISGKVLDAESNGNGIAYAPVFASDANGNSVPGGTADANGSYTVFVDAGTWTVSAALPPDKTDSCGTFSKTVTITTESKANENIIPATSTCYEISGTVQVGETLLANSPLFVSEWDTVNSRSAANGMFRPSSTDSNGAYKVKVAGSKTYRIGTFHSDYGELSVTQAVTTASVANVNITTGATGTLTFAFTGGTSSMKAFVEVKKSDDATVRVAKPKTGLDTNLTLTVKQGTYNYFVNVDGWNQRFTGTIQTGNTATINLGSSSFVTLSGNVKDGNTAQSSDVPGALVIVRDSSGGQIVKNAVTDASGNYTMSLKAGTYTIGVSGSGYIAGQADASLTLSADTANYDFGGASGDQLGMVKADRVITGTIFQTDGITRVNDGFVTAVNSTNLTVTGPISKADGTYSLPVPAGTWTLSARVPGYNKETKSGTVTITTADSNGQNITMTTVNAARNSKTANKSIDGGTGGSLDDRGNTGIKLTAPGGSLQSKSGNVALEFMKKFMSPDPKGCVPLGGVLFDITATDSNNTTVKDLKNDVDVQIDINDLVGSLPSGITEADLQLMYYSPERDACVPLEGGSNVDAANDTITGSTDHLTSFIVAYSSTAGSSVASTTSRQREEQVAQAPATGGGGGSAPAVSTKDSNTTTNTISSKLEVTVSKATVLDRPIKLDAVLMKTDPSGKGKTAQLTGEEGSITLKPNENSTVSVEVPADTTVTGTQDWNGNITPPLVKPVTLINSGGESITGSSAQKLTRDNVSTIVYVGSTTSALTFSNPVTLNVPVTTVADGTVVQIYSSEDGDHWTLLSPDKLTVTGGKVSFPTTHFTYFAVVKTGETAPAPLAAAEERKTVEQKASEAASVAIITPFTDIVNHWSEAFVEKLLSLGVVSGKTATAFAPDDAITRAEITKIALNAFGYDVPSLGGAKAFKDIDAFAWYAPYIQVAKNEKIIGGYEDGTFRPNQPVTRAEALKILASAAKTTIDPKGVFLFKDVEETAWYMKFVAYAKANEIAAGYSDGTFRPTAPITRAEVAKIAVKMMEK